MKKTLALLIATFLCLFAFAGCVYIPDETVTGDVKDKEKSKVDIDTPEITNALEKQTDNKVTTVGKQTDVNEILKNIGGALLEESEYLADAKEFATAVAQANTEMIASYTGGEPEYYEFLNKAEFADFSVYPFELTEEKKNELEQNSLHWGSSFNYILEFDVEKAVDGFETGKNLYFLGIQPVSIEGNLVNCFVPAKDAVMFATKSHDQDFAEYFISEFCSLYVPGLTEGRNYAEDFMFGDSKHMITHLMANSGKYAYCPPYSLDEINDFISEAFDGNEGFEKEKFDRDAWLYRGDFYDTENDGKLYGCSYAHGGTTIEHKIINVSSAEEDNRVYTVSVFADYAKFAPAYTVTLDFEIEQGEIPNLKMVRISDVTGRTSAFVSV